MLIRRIELRQNFEDLFGRLRHRPHAFFLDSAMPMEGLGRFSFIGFEPCAIFRASGNRIALTRGGQTEVSEGDPLVELRRLLEEHRTPPSQALPFTGGAVGYFSYEFGLRFEGIARSSPDDLDVPEVEFGIYDRLLAFDGTTGSAFAVANAAHGTDEEKIIGELETAVRQAAGGNPPAPEALSVAAPPSALKSNFTKREYLEAVLRVKEYIRAGDVYQVNLSQRFEVPLSCDPYALYRRLRRFSPAPFAAYLECGERAVVSSSPERFLRIQGRRIETRPIKGTRPRGRDHAEDAALARELLASEKDQAELLMIVDLERNDLGRVCDYGSIEVEERCRLERHPTVFHLVATVSGRLSPGAGAFEALKAAFPGGSITGAPKIRAMEIIDELERGRRHLYTGAIGYLGFDGNCDLNIAIRTILCSGGRAYYHVGGGIVADSDPEAEYQETLAKGRAMCAALLGDA